MKIFTKISEVQSFLDEERRLGKSIGFVPTMGALHDGHLSLIKKSNEENDCTVCSIFVNPIQFNNSTDLEKYPRDNNRDIELLKGICDLVFIPEVEEMYPEEVSKSYDFGYLENVMEGKFRPGHFNGVAVVVKLLFDIVNPKNAYFGYKDFHQYLVVRELVKQENIPVNIIGCPTLRDKDGLAMSSRNKRLSKEERQAALTIPNSLMKVESLLNDKSVAEVKKFVEDKISKEELLKFEYFEISDYETLRVIDEVERSKKYVACIAAYSGNIRLIDNIVLSL